MNPLKQAAKILLSRAIFWEFCKFYDPEFFRKRAFLKEIADAFQEVYEGKIHKLSVSMPPRAGKSYVTTLFCAWHLGKRPEESVMRNTCTATLYDKFSYDVRNVIRAEKFKIVFPESELADDRQNVSGWNLKKSRQVGYFGAGVGGTIIGFGASGLAITDDLYRGLEDALSEGKNEKVLRWKEASHDSRLEMNADGMECPEIDIGTRWSKRDVIGVSMEKGKYDRQIIIPALSAEEKSFCEAVHSTEFYKQKRDDIEKEVWNAEYQQNPIELEGLLFPESQLKRFYLEELRRDEAQAILGYIDVADEGTDHFAMAIGYVFKDAVYITDVIYTQENTDVTTPMVVQIIEDQTIYEEVIVDGEPKKKIKKEFDYVRVESNNQGSVVAKDYKRLISKDKILTVNNSANKNTRIYLSAPFVKKYFYFRRKEDIERNSHYDKFLQNVCAYMKDGSYKKDDAPDCISGLQKFIKAWLPKLFEPDEIIKR